jgi:hypothetical protein
MYCDREEIGIQILTYSLFLSTVLIKKRVLFGMPSAYMYVCAPRKPLNCWMDFIHAGVLLGLFFDPEDGGDMFLRNVR